MKNTTTGADMFVTAGGANAGGGAPPGAPSPRVFNSLLARWGKYVDVSGGSDACWLWTGRLHKLGYGQIGIDQVPHAAHRVAWILFHGPIPRGARVLHRCDVRACVNPSHHFLGTQRENVADMIVKGRRSRHGRGPTRLSMEKAREIRRRIEAGESGESLAREFGISRSHVSDVRNNKLWREPAVSA